MLVTNQTIDFKEKQKARYQSQINSYLKELPSYCTQYENFIRNRNTIHTRYEYIFDIYNFFRYLVTKNPLFSSVKDISLENLQNLNGFDFDDYLSWLSNYKYDDNDETENYKSNTAASKKRKMMAIKSLFHFLYVRDMITCNPTEKAILPKVKAKKRAAIRVLEEDEYELFLKAVDQEYKDAIKKIEQTSEEKLNTRDKLKPYMALRDKAIIYLFLGTGLRVSELCSINCSDIVFDMNYLNVIRKGDSDDDSAYHRVYFSDEVKEILVKYIDMARDNLLPDEDNYDALFISSKRSRMTPRAIEMMVKQYANKSLGTNNGITPHKLRATFGTEYYAMTGDISATSTAMNHAGIEITAKYYIREDKEAAEKAKQVKIKKNTPSKKSKKDVENEQKYARAIQEGIEEGKRDIILKLLERFDTKQVADMLAMDESYIISLKNEN